MTKGGSALRNDWTHPVCVPGWLCRDRAACLGASESETDCQRCSGGPSSIDRRRAGATAHRLLRHRRKGQVPSAGEATRRAALPFDHCAGGHRAACRSVHGARLPDSFDEADSRRGYANSNLAVSIKPPTPVGGERPRTSTFGDCLELDRGQHAWQRSPRAGAVAERARSGAGAGRPATKAQTFVSKPAVEPARTSSAVGDSVVASAGDITGGDESVANVGVVECGPYGASAQATATTGDIELGKGAVVNVGVIR